LSHCENNRGAKLRNPHEMSKHNLIYCWRGDNRRCNESFTKVYGFTW